MSCLLSLNVHVEFEVDRDRHVGSDVEEMITLVLRILVSKLIGSLHDSFS